MERELIAQNSPLPVCALYEKKKLNVKIKIPAR
jgi:hypothetical protein